MKNKVLLIFILILCMFSSTAFAEEWKFQLEPYAMASNIEGNASIGRAIGADVDVDFSTILENLEGAALIHFEAHHQTGWGLSIDYGFMELGGKTSNDNGSSAKVTVRQGVFEALGIYKTALSNGTLDYFTGIRWWDNDLDFDIKVSALSGDGIVKEIKADWIDIVLGVRWQEKINENWSFHAQADIGGFGLESEFTSSLSTGVQYKISDLMTLNLKYKATWVDFDEGNIGQPEYFEYDTVTHGPIIGLIFNF